MKKEPKAQYRKESDELYSRRDVLAFLHDTECTDEHCDRTLIIMIFKID